MAKRKPTKGKENNRKQKNSARTVSADEEQNTKKL